MIVCFLLLAVAASSQRTFSFLNGNAGLSANGWNPRSYERWSRVFRGVRTGATVTIPAGRAVRVDVASIPRLSGLRVDGLLYFPPNSNVKLRVQTGYVLVRGFLRIGSTRTGMTGSSEVTFQMIGGRELRVSTSGLREGSRSGPQMRSMNFGTRAFAVLGGQLEIAGLSDACSRNTWRLLASTVNRGARRIRLQGNLGGCWRRGMQIAIAASGYSPRENERRTIVGVSGSTLTLNAPLQYTHLGQNENKGVRGLTAEFGAEVILLSRPVKFQSDNAGELSGGHLMIAHTSSPQLIRGAEFSRMGQRGTLGRYPIHAHLCGNAPNFNIVGNSVYDSSQRGIVIHASNRVTVRNNVLHTVAGHGIMVAEDHFATNIEVQSNVVIGVRRIRQGSIAGSTDNQATGIWVGNPQNNLRGNRAGGCERSGIWYEMVTGVTGSAAALPGAASVNPRSMPLTVFVGNVAHSCADHGVRFYPEPWRASGRGNLVNGLKSYRNLGAGIILHANVNTRIVNSVFYDNREGGVDFDRSKAGSMSNSVVIGNSRRPLASCPSGAGVQFPPTRAPENNDGHQIDGVSFDGYRGCAATPFTIDPTDTVSAPGWVGSILVKNINIVDNSDPVRMSAITSRSGNNWDRDIAIRLENSLGVRNGFFISDNNFMNPVGGRCARRYGGLVCQNKCYREVLIILRGMKSRDSNYQIRVRRIADGRVKVVSAPRGGKFYFNAEGNQAYELDLIRRNGAGVPSGMQIEMADTNYACNAGIELRFNNRGYSMRFLRFGVIVNPVSDCGRAPVNNRPTYYNRCAGRTPQSVLKINPGPLPPSAPLGIRVALANGTPRCVRGC